MLQIDNDKVIWKEINNQVTILLIPSGHSYELNPMGSHIWKLMIEGKNKDEIFTELKNSFKVSKWKLRFDINLFYNRLKMLNLLR